MRRGLGDALRVCYPLLREKLASLRKRGLEAFDISDAFNESLEPIFTDGYHVESTGNRLIANAILKKALHVLKGSSESPEVEPPRGEDQPIEPGQESAQALARAFVCEEAS
jgi:hypothetical protein